jgi:hypothetical protein
LSSSPPEHHSEPLRPAHFVLPGVLAVLSAFLFIRQSIAQGKLLVPPLPDDVNYMMDAALRLNAFDTGGVRTLLAGYIANPPHSPFSSLLALLSFTIFGMHEWAPYSGNALVAFAFFGLAAFLVRDLASWQRAAILLMLFPLPVVAVAIREFRPDLAAALCIVLGVVLAAERPLSVLGWRRWALVGAAFGAALLAKPSTFPVTLLLFVLTVVGAGLADRRTWTLREPRRRAVRGGLVATAALVALAGPHFLLAARRIVAYIHNNIFGDDRELWVVQGSILEHLRYYIDGPAGQYQLGYYAWPAVALAAAAGVFSLLWNDPDSRRRSALVAAVGLAAYVLATANQVKQEFFGLPFQLIMLFGGIMGLRLLLIEGQRRLLPRLPWSSALLVLLMVASLLGFRFWMIWAPPNRPPHGLLELRRLHEEVYQSVRRHSGHQPAQVFITFNGEINWKNLQFRAAQDHMPLTFRSRNRDRTPELYAGEYEQASLIVAADPDHPHIWRRIQNAAFHAEVLQDLQQRPDLALLEEVRMSRRAERIYIFRRMPAGAQHSGSTDTAPGEAPG